MSRRDGTVGVTLNVHVDDSAPMEVRAYDATDKRGPFVIIGVGEGSSTLSLFFQDEASINRLIKAAGSAHGKLVGALTRAKREQTPRTGETVKQEQSELPEMAAP